MNTKVMQSKYILHSLILILFILGACDEKFEEINTNPNAVTKIDDGYLFSNTVLSTLRGDNNTRSQFPFGSQYGHFYVGQNNAMFIDRYFDYFTSTDYEGLMNAFYQGPIRQVQEVIRFTQPGGENENEVRHAMAKTISFISFSRLADSFGSIPYVEGGIGQLGYVYPKYDEVKFIYQDMLENLKTNYEILSVADPDKGYILEDPLYNNNLEKWARFANSLRLRLAMRIRFAAPELANPIIAECLTLPLVEDHIHSAGAENQESDLRGLGNPMYNTYQYWQWKMSDQLVETLKSNMDPRLEVFVAPNQHGEYLGIPNGLSEEVLISYKWADISDPSKNLVGQGAPSTEMSAAEIWLLRAEAALFDLGPGDANELYRMGIRRSLEQWKVGSDTIDLYLNNAACTILSGSQEEMFEQICTQHWLASIPNFFEAWTNMRRTGYPRVPKRTEPRFSLGITNGEMPKRMRYPSSEININRENYEKAIEQQGPDLITTPIWWDVRD